MANRYDNGSVAKFNPFSYQELAVTPMMMRQKHDASIAAAEAMRIQANPLDVHLARAQELKQQMDNEIAKNVDELNSKGYNPTTYQNIQRLNRQYQDLISPTGEIGQINNAKVVYDKAKEDFIQDAAKQNIGRDQALKVWDKKTAYYTGFGEDGKSITNVSPQGVAAFQDYEKYKQVAKSLMGEVESESRSGGYKLVPSSLNNGTMVMVDSKGFQKKSTNLDALNNAILAGNEMWLKPTGEGYKYNQDAGVDQNNFKQRFIGDFGSMLKTSTADGYEENGQFINDATGPNGGDGSGTSGSMLIDVMTESGTKDKSYGQALSEIDRLNKLKAKKGSLTSSEQMDLEKYSSQIKGASAALTYASKYDKEYINAKKDYDNAFIEFNKKIPASLKTPWINEAKDAKTKLDRILSSAKRLGYSTQDLSNIESAYHKSLKTGEKYFNKRQQIFSKSNDYYTSYLSTPIGESAKKEYKGLTDILHKVLKSPASANGNGVIYSVKGDDNKFRALGKGDSDSEIKDYDGIVGLMQNAKSIDILDWSDINDTGIPTMTIEADMGDSESTYDLEGIGTGSKNIGGKGNKVVIKMNMNNLRTSHDGSATVDPGNFSQQFARYLINRGGKQAKLGLSMLANITRHQRDKNAKK